MATSCPGNVSDNRIFMVARTVFHSSSSSVREVPGFPTSKAEIISIFSMISISSLSIIFDHCNTPS